MSHSSTPATLAGSTILIVDDDRLNIRILRGILQSEGFLIASAESGEEALERYPSIRPDLVLLDVVLPGADGFETCRELHRRHGTATAPIIFITTQSESDDVVAGFTVDYLPKPFKPREALARIRTHLQNRQLLEQLSRANAAKNRFLGMAAHDLRNPLASIRALAQFLKDPAIGPLNEEQLEFTEMVESTAQSMLNLVNELLDVATIEAGELRLDRQPCDLAELVDRSVYLANLYAARKSTRVAIASRTPGHPVSADPTRIRQVVDNLLSNAIKFSPPGSTIKVTHLAEPDTQSVVVLDQGPGIPDDEKKLLFKDFARLSIQPTGGEKTTGLGLAICRKIIEAHGGSIEAENAPSGGCAFKFELPNGNASP